MIRRWILTAFALQGTIVFVPNPQPGVDFGPIVVVTVPIPPINIVEKLDPPKPMVEVKK